MTPQGPSLMGRDGEGSSGFRKKKGTLPSCPPSEAHLSPTDPAGRLKYCLIADGGGGCLQSFWKKSWRSHSCSVPETLQKEKKVKKYSQPPAPLWLSLQFPPRDGLLPHSVPKFSRAQSPDSSLSNVPYPVVAICLQR